MRHIKILLSILVIIFLSACTAHRNQYGIPKSQWDTITPQEQDLIQQSNQPMTFNENE